MTEQVCPICKADNPPDNRYCGQCGSRLRYHEKAAIKTPANTDVVVKPDLLPELDTRALGRTVAISIGVFVAELALQRVRRRMLGPDNMAMRSNDSTQPAVKAGLGALVGMALLAAEKQLGGLDDGQSVKRLLKRSPKDENKV